MTKKTGFTLIELMIVVIIIGILAVVAVPNFTKANEKALGKEALASLKVMAAAERVYKVEEGSYIGCTCTTTADCEYAASGCNYLLKLDLSPQNWTYAAVLFGGGIRASASRQGSGGYKDCVYTVDENGALISAASCP